ncbi:MAG: D-isomer specific 2-hydroxyacid dehydrogenase family protein [Rhodoluna sp.]
MQIAIEPKSFPEYEAAARESGGDVVPMSKSVTAVIWTDYAQPEALDKLLEQNPQVDWVQLPFAGVDAFSNVIKRPVRFTSAKGSYREPVAEHALTLALALLRVIPERVRETTWGRKFAGSLYDSNVLVFGGGGITEELLKLLAPFRSKVTVVRKRKIPLPGANKTVGFEELNKELPNADVVILAAALTDETKHLFNKSKFELMKPESVLVNIARGPMIDTADLIQALEVGTIAGAAVDVTEPEPLPDGHPLWTAKNIIITPHTADTRAQVVRLFSDRIRENVKAYATGSGWVGEVNPELGY